MTKDVHCPRCTVPLRYAYDDTVPTYPVYSDIPPVTEWRCPGCGNGYVSIGHGIERTSTALARMLHAARLDDTAAKSVEVLEGENADLREVSAHNARENVALRAEVARLRRIEAAALATMAGALGYHDILGGYMCRYCYGHAKVATEVPHEAWCCVTKLRAADATKER